VIGTSHQQTGQSCQDAFACQHLPTGEVLLTVADGAGSARAAAHGSAFSVQAAQHFLAHFLQEWAPNSLEGWQALVQATFAHTHNALVDEAARLEQPLRDLATTLLVTVLSNEWTVIGLLGDCAAVCRSEEGALFTPCRPQKGEFANTTHFLTEQEALARLVIQVLPQPMRGVALFTDGLAELALSTVDGAPYSRFFAPLFAFVEQSGAAETAQAQLSAFLASERINARTNDDKTLVLAWRMSVG
jgi:hypothetical protein